MILSSPTALRSDHPAGGPPVPPGAGSALTTAPAPFSVEVLMDLENVEFGLWGHGLRRADYGVLVDGILGAYADLLGLRWPGRRQPDDGQAPPRRPEARTLVCRRVRCVTSVPAHAHPDDADLIHGKQKFLQALCLRHGFDIDTLTLDYHGYHIRPAARRSSTDPREQAWRPRQKMADVLLSVRLLERCFADDAPDGVVVATGDEDLVPALAAAMRRLPGLALVVAGFRDAMSHTYIRGGAAGLLCPYPPIFIDDFVAKLGQRL
jgi:hypothetical protein